MRLSSLRTIGLLFLGAALLGQPGLERADGQAPASVAKRDPSQPQPSNNLPADFIDSRSVFAYFDNRPMPETVRGLLEELNRPDRCGAGAQLHTEEACALVFYKLDDSFTPDRLRPPLIMRAIYRITIPENLADTVMLMPDRDGVLKRYAQGDLFEPLRNVRANICQKERQFETCKTTESKGVLYRPYGILGKLENDREKVLPAKSAGKHFFLDLKDADPEYLKEWRISELCRQHLRVC